MATNKTPKIINETIFESLLILNKKINEGIKKRNKTKEETF